MILERRLRHLALREKLVLLTSLTTGASLLVAGAAFIGFHLLSLRHSLRLEASATAQIIASNSGAALLFNDPQSAAETLEALRIRPRFQAAALYDRKGVLFARFAQAGARIEVPERAEEDGARGREGRLVLFAPVDSAGNRIGTLGLWVDMTDLYTATAFFALTAIVVVLLCLAGAYRISLSLQRLISEPVLDLARTAQSVSSTKDYSLRAAPPGGEELDLLAEAFNEMLAQIQARDAFLLEARAGLEKRVKERTTELAARTRSLEAANKELEAFSFSVSHDLRAPLRSIAGFSHILLKECSGTLDARDQEHLSRIAGAAQRMGEIIDGLLKLSTIGRSELRRELVDLSGLARRIEDRLRQSEPARSVDFVLAPGMAAEGDASLLEVALENLLANAWKFTGDRPRARIEFGTARREGQAVFFVADDGAGFDMAHAHHLFEAFARLHTRLEFPGNGIGLATVRRILERHGGRIWAEGAMGKGSTFYFVLP